MKRRQFAAQIGLSALGLWAATPVHAQGGPVEGTHYVRLATPVAVPSGGKIDVIVFFWYGCPHCYAFEPMLETWSKTLAPDVALRRVHVGFSPRHETHAKIFYALEALGQLDAMHRKVFSAMHQQRLALSREDDIADFMAKNGIDRAQWLDAFKSFPVDAKVRQAKQLSEGYKIDGTPSLGIHGRYFTSPSLAGGPDRSLAVTDFLIQRSRKG